MGSGAGDTFSSGSGNLKKRDALIHRIKPVDKQTV